MSMIRLNLLPDDQRGRRKAPGKRPGVAGPAGRGQATGNSPLVPVILIPCVIAALAFAGWTYYQEVLLPKQNKAAAQDELRDIQTEVAALEAQYADLRETYEHYVRLARVIHIHMPDNRMMWAEKLNQISECIPDNVYITEISMREDVDEYETAESIAARAEWDRQPEETRGPEPTPIMLPEITQEMTIKGAAFADEESRRIDLVLEFEKNLTNYTTTLADGRVHRFMDHFAGQPHISYNQMEDLSGVPVNSFQIVLKSIDLATLSDFEETMAALREVL